MNITVYGGAGGSSLRVHWMLHEAGLEYQTKRVDLSKGEHKMPEFLAVNPAGQIPAIDIDGMVFAESFAITQYIAERFKPEFLGSTPEMHAVATQWALWVMFNVQSSALDLAFMVWRNAPDEEKKVKAFAALDAVLPVFETLLGSREYVAGDMFTIGDIGAVISMTYARFGGFDFSQYPNIVRWLAACESRPAYIAAKAS